jgi:hypothetical protein
MADAVKFIACMLNRGEPNVTPLTRCSQRHLQFHRDRHTVALV